MKPLDGVRVLDLTRHMAGPYATQMLSDYGADVVKVESVPHGDPSRRTGTAFMGDESGLFLIWNHGKRSLAIDMRTPEGLEVVQRLAATADVLLENYRPGVADKIGRGYRAEVSMLHALMSSLTTRLATHWFGGETPGRHGNQHSVVAPYQAFKTADGHAVAGVWGAGEAWPRFCEAVERPDLVDHPDFAENVDRVAHREALNAILRPIFEQRTTAEWRDRFQAAKGLFGPILSIPEAVEQEQALATGAVT